MRDRVQHNGFLRLNPDSLVSEVAKYKRNAGVQIVASSLRPFLFTMTQGPIQLPTKWVPTERLGLIAHFGYDDKGYIHEHFQRL
jgi:hypothetical protein